MTVAFVGGTGPAGVGLAARLARAGQPVAIGSRAADRAAAAAEKVRALAPGAEVAAGENPAVLEDAGVAFLTVPAEAVRRVAAELAGLLSGKVAVVMANPLRVEGRRVLVDAPPEGSLAEAVRDAVPGARVVSALHEIRVSKFADVDRPIDADTVLCGDDEGAKREVAALVALIDGVRPVDAGPLANSRFVEGFVAVLISINLRYRIASSYRITGLPS